MLDTATALMSSNNRPSPGEQFAHYKQINNCTYEATVIRIGMFENFECAIYVSIPGMNELMKVSAPIAADASSSTSTGSWRPYYPGDKVLITFIQGDPSRPTVVGRTYDTSGVSEYMLSQPGLPLPTRGDQSPSGFVQRPSPLATIIQSVKQAGMLNITTYPVIVL